MTTKTKSLSRDRKLISSESYEVNYAGKKLGQNGAAAVKKAKKALGRNSSRADVMKRAKSLA